MKEKKSVGDGGQIIIYKPVPSFGRNAISSLSGIDNAKEDMDEETPKTLEPVPPLDMCKDITPLRILFESSGPEVLGRAEQDQGIAHTQPNSTIISSDDGYHWRKYGQKQVKGSEFPRSYYKCTHPNCQVKKKLERSHDGHITEIIYKGEHNHPKPQSTRRASMGANGSNKEGLYVVSHNADGHDHRVETSVSRGQMGSVSNGTPEPSLGSTSDVEVEGEASKAENGDDDDEPDSKRRYSLESELIFNVVGLFYAILMFVSMFRKDSLGEFPLNLSLRTTREPRVVVQTLSEVDILDDGYRWRKYGQKIVKGNPHPRYVPSPKLIAEKGFCGVFMF